MATDSDKKLLTRRTQSECLDSILDDCQEAFAKRFGLDDQGSASVREYLRRQMERLLTDAEHVMQLGVSKGIEEAVRLIRDPNFYETVKKRKAKFRAENQKFTETIQGRRALSLILDGGDQ